MMDRDLLNKAESGDVDAMISLGRAYYDQEDGYENSGKAFELFTKAIELEPNNAQAINNLGNCYSNGIGVEENTDKAIVLYRKAAELGHSGAQYNLADELKRQNNAECLEWYQKAFENGDTDAPYDIANIYKKGEIVPVDYQKYIEYLIKADEMGNHIATLDLAASYLNGKYAETNKVKGIELMEKAANAGNMVAAGNMSLAYRKGEVVEFNIEKSIEWAKKAAELGYGDSICWYGVAYLHGQEPVTENKEKAIEFFAIAANAGSTTAMENLGECYCNGNGVDIDKNKAIEWFEKAAREGGSKKAMNNLQGLYSEFDEDTSDTRYFELVKAVADDGFFEGMVRTHFCYRDGKGTEKDMEKAMQYLDKAVEYEDANACFIKALYFHDGCAGLEKDSGKAVQLLKIAANGGLGEAADYLGACYRDGDGVEVDVAKALEWFEKAKDLGNMMACVSLGLAYDDNGFAGTDFVKAVGYYKEAYENGSVLGALCLASKYENGRGVEQNIQKSFELYKYAADHGSARGMAMTGMMLHDGVGTQKDVKLAIEYFEKANTVGWADADDLLAIAYKKMDSPDVDPQKAFEFNLQRASQGDIEAQYHVYKAYFDGIGVKEDEEKANEWLKKAADGGHDISQAIMGLNEMVLGNVSTGMYYLKKACDNGNLWAMSELAGLYLKGDEGVPMNKNRAIELYKKAAEEGYAKAQVMLGLCYLTGNGVSKNEHEAFRWFSLAAEQGDFRAKLCLADMYAEGEGATEDYNKAEKLYQEVIANGESDCYEDAVFRVALMYTTKTNVQYRAFPLWQQLASRGNTAAKFNLGLCYYNGWGTDKDDSQALYWWRQAAEEGYADAEFNMRVLEENMCGSNNCDKGYQNTNTAVSQKSGGCYVATAVYGSYDCPEVWTLRRYRDYTLSETWYGRAFIKLYYAISPILVKWFGETAWFKKLWRGRLDRFVRKLQDAGIENTPYEDRHF